MANKTRINWKEVVKVARQVAIDLYNQIGSPVTLRAIFYALVSRNVIPNTKSAYKRLSSVLTEARKKGEFEWYLIKDETRRILGGDFGWTLNEISQKAKYVEYEYVEDLIHDLEKIKNARFHYTLQKWEGQPYRVLICLEKDALADAIESMVSDWKVEVLVMRGYASATSLKNLADKIQSLTEDGYKVVVLLLTDFDPSGEDIARYVKETLLKDFNVQAEVYKVAVTLEQIKKYNLPATPESLEEKKKMARDPRFKKWQYGYFRVELDAMVGLVPDELRKILHNEIAKYFDNNIYEQVRQKQKEIENQARERLKQLWSELEDLYNQLKKKYEELKKLKEEVEG